MTNAPAVLAPTTLADRMTRLAAGDRGPWQVACARAGELVAERGRWRELVGTDPGQDILTAMVAVAVYALGAGEPGGPGAVTAEGISSWFADRAEALASRDHETRRAALAALEGELISMLAAAGHDAPRGRVGGRWLGPDVAPVLRAWASLVDWTATPPNDDGGSETAWLGPHLEFGLLCLHGLVRVRA
ncbi:hypothetical protein Lfu02_15220 [Longispora fulva]|uniref:Uncharacterized protein n=1 Tax=Longispora fulva TaxID=619741 RepID=A0A8J7GNU8_9ACTN|nr:hypothetical protein [Longispora fulva]MBG6140468.1 hypothetical protein [Longispora fulva]GIG57150.1 hypothetical protein Lfu02_15220 [Longispora fulva]